LFADTCQSALSRLDTESQKARKMAAFVLQMDPAWARGCE
jgi:hypothetical protein